MFLTLLTGLLTGLSLIVAIGAQNAFVLRQGLAREHVGVVVAICAFADLALILAGVAGFGAVVRDHPAALTVFKWLGAAYLVWFGVRSLLAARHPQGLRASTPAHRTSVVTTTLTLTFLNPHVYLDTVLMLGNVANQHGSQGRWWFAAGASLGSVLWFTALGYGARLLSDVIRRPRTWQLIDVLIGMTMLVIAVLLVTG
ncbi:LysE/ArgO family amino acid transporter [Flexivirga meconopsidis]|uniref:LysE/ArgO family amino acid transporter n=1 Tax=Flexivirga meconopsidis TaxID=2977121 RepID=UPI0022406872|nr:LysE family transporter [Flexivirga meconopsidis]